MSGCDSQLPEPFYSALASGQTARVCGAPCQSAEEYYGRALARIAQERFADARADLHIALPALEVPSRLELAFLDIVDKRPLAPIARLVADIAGQAAAESWLAARAWHVLGWCEWQRGRAAPAVDALLKARELYGRLGDRPRRSQALDTLGNVEADRGHLEPALHFFALSLVDKALGQDRIGMALTLGNLGRVHLRAGRLADALECFQRDMEICQSLELPRGIGRMHNDLARTYLAMQNYAQAERHLDACLALARAEKLSHLEFFALKDRALLRIGQNRRNDAESDLQAAEQMLERLNDSYVTAIFHAARAELLALGNDPTAIDLLRQSVKAFRDEDLPDLEIPTRIVLARELARQRYKAQAESCLLEAIARARADGYIRYLTPLNEAMAGLQLIAGAIEENARPITQGAEHNDDGYLILERLGGGAFGEVFRVFDRQRNQELALKRLNLQQIYDPRRRDWLLKSARLELEAASRIRHDGVARIYAIGTSADGGTYVVQELIRGAPLANRLLPPPETPQDFQFVLGCLAQIAYALAALHEAGVVHRDLKPDNIMLRENGSPVLIDFGIAHLVGGNDLTAGLIVGTPEYFAPEQAAGKKIAASADLYALGVIAYEWLSGRRPLAPPDADIREIARYLAVQSPPQLGMLVPPLPAAVGALVMALLAKKPRKRPASARDVGEQWEQLAARL